MSNPALAPTLAPTMALAVVLLGLTVTVLLFWPVRGLFWRFRRAFRASDRALVEDALKHVYDCEYRQLSCTLQSLSGALEQSGSRAAELVQRLTQMNLIAAREGGFELTADGRSYALRVLRIHRLWERYLADETGLAAPEWHSEAELREHTTSDEEAEALASYMGQPRFDPHGDPIPTADGEVPEPQGMPLTELGVGRVGEIVHVEDEPPEIYAQLVAEGLHPGMRVRVSESDRQRIRLESDAEEHVLAPVVAASLSVIPVDAGEETEGSFAAASSARLSNLEPGEQGTVLSISTACRGLERRRLLDLGLVPGTRVAAEMTGPSGDPTAYRVRGSLVALRREQADLIRVEPVLDHEGVGP